MLCCCTFIFPCTFLFMQTLYISIITVMIDGARLHAIMIIALLHPVEPINETVNRTDVRRIETKHTVSRRAQQRSTSFSVLKMVHIRHLTGPWFNKQRSPSLAGQTNFSPRKVSLCHQQGFLPQSFSSYYTWTLNPSPLSYHPPAVVNLRARWRRQAGPRPAAFVHVRSD